MTSVSTLTRPAVDALRDALRVAMVHECGGTAAWAWPEGLDENEFLAAVRRHRVAETLWTDSSALFWPPYVRDQIETERDSGYVSSLKVARNMIDAQSALRSAGVRTLAVKGPALAAQTTGDFRARGGGDVDLLVAENDLEQALDCLFAHGWRSGTGLPARGSWAWRHVRRTHYEITISRQGIPLDLHWRLAPAPGALPDVDELWPRRAQVDFGGSPVATLGILDALIHSCHHAAKDDWTWIRSLIDVHRLARATDALSYLKADPDPAVQMTVALAVESLGPVPDLSHTLPPPRTVRVVKDRQEAPRVTEPIFPLHRGVPRQIQRLSAGGHPVHARWLALLHILLPLRIVRSIADPRAVTAIARALAARVRDLPSRIRQRLRRDNRPGLPAERDQ